MTDRLTQIQDCLDQLLTQMYASLRYIDTHHPYAAIEGQSDQNPFPQTANISNNPNTNNSHATQPENPSSDPPNPAIVSANVEGIEKAPDAPQLFAARLQELAQDLVMKEQQIEVLVDSLPGLGNSQEEQEARIRELEGQLRDVEGERKEWGTERERLLGLVEGKIMGVRRV